MMLNGPIIKIGSRLISEERPVFIIAEAGVNHNGRLDLALKLVDAAAAAGADAVKFQTFKAEQIVTSIGKMAEYQKKNIGKTESQLDMLKKLEFNESWYPKVISHCKKRGIIFFSTPHGSFASVDLLQGFGVPLFKFGSGDLTSLPILEYAAKFKKPIILGTGMATMKEVKEAIGAIKKTGNSKIIILHCTTNYPTKSQEVNLRAMQSMAGKLNVLVGYSDHTLGSQVAVMATALGACVIEKHLTLDNNLPGPDHAASANPDVFKKTVEEIRNAEVILGSPVKRPGPNELQYIPMVRRSVVATKSIKRGEKFSLANIDLKRPGTGLPPKDYFKIIGTMAKVDIKADALIEKKHYEKA